MTAKRLILITGPQGAGKSTYVKELSLKLGFNMKKGIFVHIKGDICIWGKYNMKRRLGEFEYSSGGGNDNIFPKYVWTSLFNCFVIRECDTVIMEGVIHCWRSGRGRDKVGMRREESYEYLENEIKRFKEIGIKVILVHLMVSKKISEERYEDRYPSKWTESKELSRTAEKIYDKIISDIDWMKTIVDEYVEINTEKEPKEVLQEIENLVRKY